MTDLFWPGDERAGELMSDPALLHAMVRVEAAWLDALRSAGVAPAATASDNLASLVTDADVFVVATRAEAGGNPVIPLVALLRERLGEGPTATWLHRGLTSQDVLDTALMLCATTAVMAVRGDLRSQIATLADLADEHRGSLMAGRTLTQHAVPITFGLKTAGWLDGLLDAAADLDRIELPAQLGGAAGTLAAPIELLTLSASASSVDDLQASLAATLGLPRRSPWHTSRAPITRLGDALVRCTDAWGRIANDVLTLSRPEIAELSEATGGSSSTMPHKANPVLSVLIRRAAMAAPGAGAQLHLAAAGVVDERPDGSWHVEWSTLRTLTRHTVVAARQATELFSGLRVDVERMRDTATSSAADLLAERGGLAALFDAAPSIDPAAYLGANDQIIDTTLARARAHLQESQ